MNTGIASTRQARPVGGLNEGRRIIDLRTPVKPRSYVHPTVNFGIKVNTGNSATVTKGYVVFHGVGKASLATQDITISAPESWVYVQVQRGSLVATIEQGWEYPMSDASVLRLAIAHVNSTSSEGVYTWYIEEVCHEGDFHFDVPLR